MTRIFDDLWATLMFFTRLPLWRVYEPQAESFRRVVRWWPVAGWLTGGVMMGAFILAMQWLPLSVAVVVALLVRTLLTGALHEDGLADFCDGMGGGRGRERVLAIMKDSHIGTYGVLGLVGYYLLMYASLRALPVALVILTADVWGKACASLLVATLPYARTEAEAKNRLTYESLGWLHAVRIGVAMLPVVGLWWYVGIMPPLVVFIVPLLVVALLALWLKARLGGYTGDTCGAAFLLCEVSIYLSWLVTL